MSGGWVRKDENKAKPQHSTDIIPSKLIAELQHSARLGRTFPGGWVGKRPLGQLKLTIGWAWQYKISDHYMIRFIYQKLGTIFISGKISTLVIINLVNAKSIILATEIVKNPWYNTNTLKTSLSADRELIFLNRYCGVWKSSDFWLWLDKPHISVFTRLGRNPSWPGSLLISVLILNIKCWGYILSKPNVTQFISKQQTQSNLKKID